MRPPSASQELCSWKEIAAYLGVSVKTAQLWEQQRGMPIRRLPGARGQVRALVGELEEWKISSPVAPAPVAESPIEVVPSRSYLRWAVVGVISVLVGLATTLFLIRPAVASVRVESDGLAALDKNGDVIWRRILGPLESSYYQAGEHQPWIGDVNQDGKREILFVPFPPGPGPFQASIPLVCLREDGSEAWRYTPSRQLRRGADVYDNFYVARQFVAIGNKIVVTSHHGLRSPTQVAVLDSNGKLLREYWHPGHLNAIASGVYRNKPVALLVGVNNLRSLATLVVLDPERLEGAALHEEQPSFDGMQAGVEEARILFPRSKVALESPYNAAFWLVSSNLGWTVHVREKPEDPRFPTITFHLSKDLELMHYTLSDLFRSYFQTNLKRVWSAQDDAELSKLIYIKSGSD